MRKLASVQSVSEVNPIPEADAIEVARIRGWDVVVKKGQFKPGDRVVYFEIDSFLRDGVSSWQFLVNKQAKQFNGQLGHVLRTVKLRGQLSQGLALPLEALGLNDNLAEGTDLTEILDVGKYEPPVPASLGGEVLGGFPSEIQKTNQERIQNLFEDFSSRFRNMRFEKTLKLDGSSMTAYYHNGKEGVCGRNWELKISEKNKNNTLVRLYFDKCIQTALRSIGRNVAVQGEVLGPGIQGNRENLKQHQFFLFDVYDIDAGRHMLPDERIAFVDQLIDRGYHGDTVPVVGDEVIFQHHKRLESLLQSVDVPSINHPIAEGMVFKSWDLHKGQVVSFKAISNRYLLKNRD